MSDTQIAPDATTDETVVTLTEAAAEKVRGFIASADEEDDLFLRVAVQAGGCAGFKYALVLDDRDLDGDVVETHNGVDIHIDQMSAPYLQGTVIDWKESLEASGFNLENPNASGSCACGDSATF